MQSKKVKGEVRDILPRTSVVKRGKGPGGENRLSPTIQDAIRDNRVIEIDYYSHRSGKNIRATVRPYGLISSQKAWYLVGYWEGGDKLYVFKLARVERIRSTDRTFDYPQDFSIEDYLGNSWYLRVGEPDVDVVIKFDAKVGRLIEETLWHKTQETIPTEDGGVIFKATVSGIEEVGWWVMGYGEHAQVIQPPELREWVIERIEGMRGIYGLK